jgi:hypothetical protein
MVDLAQYFSGFVRKIGYRLSVIRDGSGRAFFPPQHLPRSLLVRAKVL